MSEPAQARPPADRCVVISGCSGGGKSTLLAELARRGHAVVEEPGRRIVEAELRGNGQAPPWPEIYVQDDARRQALTSATQEYEHLLAAYPSCGYAITLVPKADVAARADFVLRTLQDDVHACGAHVAQPR